MIRLKKQHLNFPFLNQNLSVNSAILCWWRIIIFIAFILLCTFKTRAQQTFVYTQNIKYYQRAVELFQKEKYAAAQIHFNWYAKITSDKITQIDAEYFAAVCAMELFNADADLLLKKIINNYGDNVKAKLAWYQLAKYYYRNKDNKSAVNCFNSFDPTYLTKAEEAEYYFTKGYCFFKIENYDEAEKAFVKIKNDKTKYYDAANYYYAYALYKKANYQASLEHFERVKYNKTFGPLATVYIAQIYFARKQYELVIEYCEALTNNDVADDVAGMLAQSYYQLNNFTKALPHMERFIASAPVVPSNNDYFRIAFIYYTNKNYNSAIEYFLKINTQEDTLAQYANFYLGSSYIKNNKKPQAIVALNKAAKLGFIDSLTFNALFNSAKLSEELKQQADAINQYVKLINLFPNEDVTDEARSNLSNLLLNSRNYKEALKILNAIKKPGEKEKIAIQRVSYYRAEELYISNDYENAEDLFKSSLSSIYDRKLAGLSYFWLGEIAAKHNNFERAKNCFKKFQEFNEVKQTRFYNLSFYNLGYNYLKIDDFEKAMLSFNDYIKLDRKMENPEIYTDALTRLADCYFVVRNYDKAIEHYNLIVSKDLLGSDYALYQKSLILGVLNQTSAKENTLKHLIKDFPKSTYIDDAIYDLANLYLQTENFNDALAAFDNLINNYPRSIFIRKSMLNKGLVYYNQSNDELALNQFKKLITAYSNSDEAREALVVIKNIFINKGESEGYLSFVKVLPNVVISPSVQDSITYESAFNSYKANDCTKASKSFSNYINKFPGGFFILKANYYKAECDFKLKNYDEALVCYEYVASNMRSDFSERSVRQSAVIYYMKKDYAKAFEYYASLERISGNKDNMQVALIGMMRCAEYLNSPDTAAAVSFKYLNSGIAQKEGIIEAKLHIARFYMARNKFDSAQTEFNYVLKETKNVFAAEAKYNLALIQFNRKEFKTAQKTIFDLNEQFSIYEDWRVRSFILLADTYVKTNEYFQAKATLQSIIEAYEGEELLAIAKAKLKEVIDLEDSKKSNEKKQIENRIQLKNK